MTRRRRDLRRTVLLLVALAAALAGLVVHETNALRALELETVDARFGVRGERPVERAVALVTIDDETFERPGTPRWQDWSRRRHAQAIRHLDRAGARVIAYDVQFTEQSDDPEADLALFEAAADAGNVVFATTETGTGGRTNVLGGDENLREIGATAGQSLLPNDPGGTIRRMPAEVGGLRGFSWRAAERAAGRRIPSPGTATPWIDFAGPPGTIPSIPFWRVRIGRFDPALVRGRIVVVGPSAPVLQDVHPTSTTSDDLMAGAEIQANGVATALRGFPLRDASGAIDLVLIVLMAFATPLALLRLRPRAAIPLVAVAAAGLLVGAQLAFEEGRVIAVATPMLALVLGGGGSLAAGYVIESRERTRMRQLFGRFVPDAVVDQVVDCADEDLRLGGVRLESTVLFSDLRGFTSVAETLEPREVIEVLNAYLTEMSDAILDHGGTLVAYMGDGIMAVFGAPIEQEDHAQRAFDAAQAMVFDRLPRFNAWLATRGMPAFRMGVGLNTGPVMSGNVGSTRRLEYTAVGDTTNTAARLEGMTKGTPYQVYVSDTTRSALRPEDRDRLEDEGEVTVRGRAAALRVWGLPDRDAVAPPPPPEAPPAASRGDAAAPAPRP